jgi:hypothetical protein
MATVFIENGIRRHPSEFLFFSSSEILFIFETPAGKTGLLSVDICY